MNFFKQLQDKNLLDDWIPILDWLFDGQRSLLFSRRRNDDRAIYMAEIEKLPYFDGNNWIVEPEKKQEWSQKRTGQFCVKMIGNHSDGETLIRHIRNGIAHGTCSIVDCDGKDMLEIYDYTSDDQKKQTAYLWLPIYAMYDLYQIYK